MGDVIDIRGRLDTRAPMLAVSYLPALCSIALAFAKHAGIDGYELAEQIERARTATDVDSGAVAVLDALNYEWG